MKIHRTRLILILVITFIPNLILSADHPANGGDGVGVRVRLDVPRTEGMIGEIFPFLYILENVSDKPIPMAVPYEKYGLGWPMGGQVYLEPDTLIQEPMFDIHNASWPPINDPTTGSTPEAWEKLNPGERIIWNQHHVRNDAFGSASPATLQAHWLLRKGEWISSEKIQFALHDVYESRQIAFAMKWSSHGKGNDEREDFAYIIQIGAKKFLYWHRYQIAMVDDDDVFEHHIDDHGTNLKIIIEGSSRTLEKFVHLRHGFVADKPWPIGPVTIFTPKPEPIPHDELIATRLEMGLNPDGSVPEGGPLPPSAINGKAAPASSTVDNPDDSSSPLKTQPLGKLLLAVIAIITTILLVLKIRKSKVVNN